MRVFSAILLLALAIWLILPTRNEFGRADDETLLTKCRVEQPGAIVRLYKADGNATVAFNWSVSVQKDGGSEWQVFYTYSSPTMDRLECEIDKARVYEAGTGRVVTEIDEQILSAPKVAVVNGLYRNEDDHRFRDPYRKVSSWVAVLLIVSALALLSRSLRRN